MNHACRASVSTFLALGLATMAGAQSPSKDREKSPALEMSKAVACKKIDGYEKFEVLPDAAITSDEKLQVYFRPLNYKVETIEKPKPGFRFRARFSQDGRIRRKGDKVVLMKKELILEYEPTFGDPTERIYLVNNVGLKGLTPGDYEYDIILRDDLVEGSTATQTVAFTVIPTPKAEASKTDEPAVPESTTGPKVEPKKTRKTAKKGGSR